MSSLPGVLKYSCCANGCGNSYYNPLFNENHVNKKFFKFPDKHPQRRRQWFEIMKLVETDKRRHLCEDHFEDSAFTACKTKLKKFAIPSNKSTAGAETLGIAEVMEYSAIGSTTIVDSEDAGVETAEDMEISSTSILSTEECVTPRRKSGILAQIGESTVKNLSPKKKKMYFINRNQQKTISRLRKALSRSKYAVKDVYENVQSGVFDGLEGKLDPVGVRLLKSIFRNASLKRPFWTTQDKIFAMTLFKKGPKAYNFLKRFFPLPSRSTIQKVLQSIPIDVGLNEELLKKIFEHISKYNALDRCCTVVFDEIALSEQAVLDVAHDKIVGLVDLGSLGRKNQLANHALVFMAQGIHKKWKQPVAFYFTKGTVQTTELKHLLCEVISTLQGFGLEVMATVCDQGATNRAAIRQLCSSVSNPSQHYFLVNGQKIFCLFDPPHLLKSTRNAFLKYDIQFENVKLAKFRYIRDMVIRDQTRMARSAAKMREEYVNLERYPQYKMKVSIAAKTLSGTVAAMIESALGYNAIPSDAVHTVEFILDIDHLFDSFNGSRPRPINGKKYRTSISKRSLHLDLWNTLLPKIQSWKFCSRDGVVIKSEMPFKSGWLRTISAAGELWKVCRDKKFQFLRTRALNQDCLENFFAAIRHYGATNSHPNCYQFISCFKTAILNNLITPPSNKNCEQDDGSILCNLQTLVEERIAIPISEFEHNELDDLELPPLTDTFDAYESQAVAYVGGYLVRKFRNFQSCEKCMSILVRENLEPQHLFTSFKENDEKRRLTYVSEDVTLTLIKIFDIVLFVLPKLGHISHITSKLKFMIRNKSLFTWFTCEEHLDFFTSDFLECSVSLIIRKYYDDIYRKKQLVRRRNRMTGRTV